MKKTIFWGILALVILATQGVAAQNLKPEPSSPAHIAMTFYKLTRQIPDFDAWVRASQIYNTAADVDKPATLHRERQELNNRFSLLTLQEPLVVETPVTLSAYNAAAQGFFVENFKDDTFFPAHHLDHGYAIVPQGIIDRQFLKVEDPALASTIEAARDRALTMVLLLSPKYADNTAPASLDGKNHWLISAGIEKMTLYISDLPVPLWQSQVPGAADVKFQELLNLRQ